MDKDTLTKGHPTPLIRPDFRCTSKMKYYKLVPFKRGHTSLIRPLFHCRKMDLSSLAVVIEV
jgi:hypothetical protein